jgi:hypothetical protein
MSISDMSSGTVSFLQIWLRALTKPNESTYSLLAASPRAKASKAFLWIFLCTLAPALVSVLVSGSRITQRLQDAGVDTGVAGRGFGAAAINFLCVTPFAAALGVVGFIISVGLMQWVARMFKGQGTFDQLAYTLGAITAPGVLITAVLTLPSLIPVLGICSGLLSLLFSIYLFVLEVTAIKAVHKFGLGAAIGTAVIPGLALAVILCCAIAVIVSVTGFAFGDVFKTIGQSLMQ